MNKRDVPAEVEVELVSRLFNALPQVLCVTTGFVAGSAFIAIESGDRWMWAILAIAILTSAARIGGVLAFRRFAPARMSLQQARRWECAYSWPALAFATGIAIMTVRVFSAGWVNGEIFAIGLTMALTAGSCARTLRYWLCASLSTISLGALIVMLTLSGDPVRMGIASLFALYLWSVYESSRHIVGQVEALLIAEHELDIAARRDPLTGLANRRAFDEALARASATGNFALLLLDLDGFKAVNDRLGHAAGDDLLRQVAGRLKAEMPDQAHLARLGGDEFAIVLPGADALIAKRLADRVIASVGSPYAVLGVPAIVGVSIGIEVAGPGSVEAEELKRTADRGLYAAKAAGKGQAILASAA